MLETLQKQIEKYKIETYQEFIVFPDPQYWQITSTLIYDRVLNFVKGLPINKRAGILDKPKPPSYYYKQMQNTFLNHGSLAQRSEGKNTYFRRIALAKRAELTLRAMIIPAPFLKPNEIIIPASIEKDLHLKGKWIILNRMPSLTPENFVGLKVVSNWPHYCFGIPLEIAQQMNADFDGDECNAYVVLNPQSQAECETILNSEYNISSFTMELKLTPCHDMLVTYYLKYNDITFLPFKNPSLHKTFRVIYDLYGSKKCFEIIDKMREYYLHYTQNEILFALSLQDILYLEKLAKNKTFEEFLKLVKNCSDNCLTIQIKSGAKGTFYHLYQLVGSVGFQYTQYSDSFFNPDIKSSFLKGLSPTELVIHAQAGFDASINTSAVWVPGYNFFKLCNNLQDLTVNYLGQLVDKQTIIANDVVTEMHCEDLISTLSFKELINKYLTQT
ncbi:RPOLA_N domain-containing protein [Trichonephila clavipes]|nr:RPOLA_N domain-containing protein [Trichonephila clavipes]